MRAFEPILPWSVLIVFENLNFLAWLLFETFTNHLIETVYEFLMKQIPRSSILIIKSKRSIFGGLIFITVFSVFLDDFGFID